jgi:serine/threonine protein kinase
MQGRAVPASDQYALAATAIQLASGTPPAQMASSGMQLDFRPHCDLPDDLTSLLERMLAPRPVDRFDGPNEALEALESGAAPTSTSSVALARREFPDREDAKSDGLDEPSPSHRGDSTLTEAWRRSKADNQNFGFYELTVVVALLLLLVTFPLMLADLVGTRAGDISVVVIAVVGVLYFKARFNRWHDRY